MRKFLIISIIFLSLSFITINLVYADDAPPTSEPFLELNNKINCVSIVNPEATGPNHFLVFDYSSEIGASLGRPWSIIEKGKCYQLDLNSPDGYAGAIYSVKILNGKEKEMFENYSGHQPTEKITPVNGVSQIWNASSKFNNGMEKTDNPFGFVNTSGDDIFPIRESVMFYLFENDIPENSPAADDLKQLKDLSSRLYQQIADVFKSCDDRIKVEYRLEYGSYSDPLFHEYLDLKKVIWQTKSDAYDFTFNPKSIFGSYAPEGINPLDAIFKMGCGMAYGQFLKSHKADFEEYNRLCDNINKKDPKEALYIFGGSDTERYDNVSEGIKALANLAAGRSPNSKDNTENFSENADNTVPTVITDNNATTIASTDTEDVFKQLNITPVTNQDINPQQATKIEQPTATKKMDILLHSKNLIMLVYIFLPLIAAIGILLFIIFRKWK